MSRIHLVRHGETIWHAANRYAGSSDISLTPRGADQARQLADWAGRRQISAVYSSDLSRAISTAEPAAAVAGVAVLVDPRLREVDFGAGEGLTSDELAERFPIEHAAFLARPASSPLPSGEAGVDAISRAWPALEEISESADDSEVLVVCHSTLIRLLICRAIGLDPDLYRTAFPRMRNVGITTIVMNTRGHHLECFNSPS